MTYNHICLGWITCERCHQMRIEPGSTAVICHVCENKENYQEIRESLMTQKKLLRNTTVKKDIMWRDRNRGDQIDECIKFGKNYVDLLEEIEMHQKTRDMFERYLKTYFDRILKDDPNFEDNELFVNKPKLDKNGNETDKMCGVYIEDIKN